MANYYNLNLTKDIDEKKIIGKMRIGSEWKTSQSNWLEIKSPVNSEIIGYTPMGNTYSCRRSFRFFKRVWQTGW